MCPNEILKSKINDESIHKRTLVILVFSFIISRIIFYLIGLRFDASTLTWFYQFLDPVDLKNNLFKNLLFLHIQPPGFNLFLGLVLNLSSGQALILFQTVYILIGLTMTLILFKILVEFKIPSIYALLFSLFFAVSPPVVLFENWLFYEYPVTLLLLLSSLLLYKYLNNHRWLYVFFFFLCLALIVITRTLFQLFWFIIILIWLILFDIKNLKKVLFPILIPLFIILSLYLKNYFIFKQFTSSSWFGMNLIKMTWTIPFEKITPLIENREIPEIVLIAPFKSPEIYKNYANFDTITGVPVLDKKYKSTGEINYNHVGYISVSRQYYSSAKYLINKFPKYYGLSVAKAFYAYLKPCSDSTIIRGHNRQKINLWVNFYEQYLLGNFLKKIWHTIYTNRAGQKDIVHINFLYIFIPFLYCWGIVLALKGKKLLNLTDEELFLIKYIVFNIIYVTIIGNFFETGENMRFRLLLLPYTYLLIGLFLRYIITRKSRLHKE